MAQIHELIPKIAAEIGPIGKTQRNNQQGFNFRGIDDIYDKAGPILAKNGVFSVPSVVEYRSDETTSSKGAKGFRVSLTVMYDFYAPDGSTFRAVSIGEAIDYGDKATSKALAMAHKYVLFQVFCIPVEGIDPDAESPDAGHQKPHDPGTNGQAEHTSEEKRIGADMKAALKELEDKGADKQVIDGYREEGAALWKEKKLGAMQELIKKIRQESDLGVF